MWFQIAAGLLMFGEFVYYGTRDAPHPPPAQFSLPKTDEGSAIPIVYGTCRVRSAPLAWAGNWDPEPTGGVNVYSLNMLWVVGAPFTNGTMALASIYVNNFKLILLPFTPPVGVIPGPFTGQSTFTTSNGFNLFGGPGLGGGIVGTVEFWDGRSTQTISNGLHGGPGSHASTIQAYVSGDIPTSPPAPFVLGSVDPTLIPGYRNLALCFLSAWEIGETAQMVPYSFEVTSLSSGSAADMGRSLPNDADPAAVLYDLLTGVWGRLALGTDKLNIGSFQTASLTLYGEGHGYSRAIETTDDATIVIGDVLRQINGIIFQEPTTGQLTLKLIRNDYDVNILPTVNPDNARPDGSGWYQVSGWSETLNQIRVIYTNRASAYADDQAIAQNAANVTAQGGKLRSMDVRFAGCSSADLARKLAARELNAVSRPQATASVVVNRSFYGIRPGDVVRFTWPQLGISNMVMRVANVDLGQLHKGEIALKMIRDVFDTQIGAFPVP